MGGHTVLTVEQFCTLLLFVCNPIQSLLPFSMSLCFMYDSYVWKMKFLRGCGILFTGNIKGEMESSVMIYMENLMKRHVYLISY